MTSVRKILRPMSQQSPLPEVTHDTMSLQISEKTSPIVEPRPKDLISIVIMVDRNR